MEYIQPIDNHSAIPVKEVPQLRYEAFISQLTSLTSHVNQHCVAYFGVPESGNIRLYAIIADDDKRTLLPFSSVISQNDDLHSVTVMRPAFHCFERELAEQFGIRFQGHPCLKPLRYSHNRYDLSLKPENHTFYHIEGEQLHEVGVGPVHAGIIEPGHFRFTCEGERILHLETQLGYQHRGIERLMLNANDVQRWALAQSIAGDSVVEHVSAYSWLREALSDIQAPADAVWERCFAQELERMAIHTGDLGAISGDIAFQLGAAVLGRLRTPLINFFQLWCGNRLAKPLIRPGDVRFPFTQELADKLLLILEDYEADFNEVINSFFNQPSVLSRIEKTGIVPTSIAEEMGLVGMAARSSGLLRDIRASHPYGLYKELNHTPDVKHHGDAYSRTQVRRDEIRQSMQYIRQWIKDIPNHEKSAIIQHPKPEMLAVSLTEGWRGQVCHCAVTDQNGNFSAYKIVDPSFFNWTALEYAVRENGISDFPLCNKSFNLSYSAFDL
jgi:Ni,Fe-hydrogenase III large subunit